MPTASLGAIAASIFGPTAAAAGGTAALVTGGSAAAIAGIETASIPLAASFVPGGIAAAAAAGAGAAAGSTILGTLGTAALSGAATVAATKLLSPTPKLPSQQPGAKTPIMPNPNDPTVLNQQRQMAAQSAANRVGRQSTILSGSPPGGDYSATTF